MKMFRIAWESKITGHKGHGQPIFCASATRRLSRVLNQRFPDISHFAQCIDTENEMN